MSNLDDLIKGLSKNKDFTSKRGTVRRIYFNGEEILTIFPEDKYAEFHGEYKRKAPDIGKIRPLIDHFEEKGYRTNIKLIK